MAKVEDFLAVGVRGDSMRRKGLVRKKVFLQKTLNKEIWHIAIGGLEMLETQG